MKIAISTAPQATIFPDGHFELLPHHVWLWTDAVLGVQEHGALPSVACLIALNGAGISIQGLMDHLETPPQDVLFGEIAIDLDRPLATNITYRITTRITAVERKQGRRIPAFDRVTIVQELMDITTDARIAAVKQIWIVSRRGPAQ